jgi:uncharacterized protein (TIGR03437 family)
VPPLLASPCAAKGGEFALEVDASGKLAGATYLRQPSVQMQVPVSFAVSAVNFGCLENLASGAVGPGIMQGEIFTISGTGIGPAQAVAAAPDATGHYPTTLAGVRVTIGGVAAPLLMVQAGEVHGVVPFEFLLPTVTVQVQSAGGSASPLDAAHAVNPGIFQIGGQGAILNQDGTVNSPANPAKLGSIVSIFATGAGTYDTQVQDGTVIPIPPPYIVLNSSYAPQVTFAGSLGKVLWAGAAPGLIAGVTQYNVQVPATLPAGTDLSAVPLVLIPPGVFSPAVNISLAR